MKGEIALKSALEPELLANQLFERTAGYPSLLIVCAGLLIKYGAAPGTEKRAIPHFAPMPLERQRKYTRRATFWTVWTESLQNIAEFLLLLNVAHLPASGTLKFGKRVRAKPKISAIARL